MSSSVTGARAVVYWLMHCTTRHISLGFHSVDSSTHVFGTKLCDVALRLDWCGPWRLFRIQCYDTLPMCLLKQMCTKLINVKLVFSKYPKYPKYLIAIKNIKYHDIFQNIMIFSSPECHNGKLEYLCDKYRIYEYCRALFVLPSYAYCVV